MHDSITAARSTSVPSSEKIRIGLTWQDLIVEREEPRPFLHKIGGCCSGPGSRAAVNVLKGLDGALSSGELLLVLGKPGSGCSTFLKTLAGHTDGLRVNSRSKLFYRDLSDSALENNIRGKTAYVAEADVHFAHLTVGETLDFAIRAGIKESKSHMIESISKVSQSLRLSQSTDTKVGNDLISGCSGGEKKRLTIAEILLSDSSIQCWDNPTRGLDSENAAIFIKALRQQCNDSGCMAAVTLYQASEEIFEAFDKVLVLYEGRQIFFGPGSGARAYFYDLGFAFTPRVSSGEFLASLTHPPERIIREGFTSQVPATSKQFETVWHSSSEHGRILESIQLCEERLPAATNHQSVSRRIYRRSYAEQIHLCLVRCLQRLKQDWTPSLSAVIGNLVLSIILGSMFYNMPEDTNSFYRRAALIFFVSMTNTCLGAFEGVQLWEHRSIIEKHKQYGFHHPSAEAIASMVVSLPEKFLLSTAFNIPLYFLANMRRTREAFFIFYLFGFVSLLTGSMLFRALGAVSRTVPSSIAPGSNLILLLLIYTGFVLPIPMMPPWLSWFRYINPVGYAFESLMINEFLRRKFKCSRFVHGTRRCAIMDTGFDSEFVDGTAYLKQTYGYQTSHLWRNLVWIVIIMIILIVVYLIASEYVSMAALQPHGKIPTGKRKKDSRARNRDEMESDVEAQSTVRVERKSPHDSHFEHGLGKLCARQRTTFLWRNISCEMKLPTKKSGQPSESKMILSAVDGWVLPGTLTALMGASGAGKTTLLNVLAGRPAVGIVSGIRKTNTIYQNETFSSKVGYAQQQDLHLPTMTVREAFEFSALLRQPAKYSKEEKLELVDDIILDLDMGAFQHAMIGGLNVEQQKRVTIGIELAARPELLLFLDEPTSGMDSSTAWLICKLLRKLCTNGQAVLCTIHQPSAKLFRMFDRLLLLQKGKTIYFGDIGQDAQKVTSYFEKGGAKPCKITENPAEWMLRVIDDPQTSWGDFWTQSEERKVSQTHLDELEGNLNVLSHADVDSERSREFAAAFSSQLRLVSVRNFVHDWRTPDYIFSKLWLTIGAGLINGISFYKTPFTLQGVQNMLFSIFLVCILHSNLVQLVLPQFLDRRALFEAREGLSKTYSWKVFILSNFLAELPCQTVIAVIQFVTWYFPVGSYNHPDLQGTKHERAGLMFLIIWSFTLLSTTFSQMIGTFAPDPATGINISASLWSFCLIFCGILVSPIALPGFWIWMYRVSPVTYLVNTMASVGLAGANIACSAKEIVVVSPPQGQTCGAFLSTQLLASGGSLLNPDGTTNCEICPIATTDELLATFQVFYSQRWRNFGISLVFSFVNVVGAMLLYRAFQVKKTNGGLGRKRRFSEGTVSTSGSTDSFS